MITIWAGGALFHHLSGLISDLFEAKTLLNKY
jgi:hypothetical protein